MDDLAQQKKHKYEEDKEVLFLMFDKLSSINNTEAKCRTVYETDNFMASSLAS